MAFQDRYKDSLVVVKLYFNTSDPRQLEAYSYLQEFEGHTKKKYIEELLLDSKAKNTLADGSYDEEALRTFCKAESYSSIWADKRKPKKKTTAAPRQSKPVVKETSIEEVAPKKEETQPDTIEEVLDEISEGIVEKAEAVVDTPTVTSQPTSASSGLASMMTAPKKPKFELSKEDQGYVDMFPDDFNKQVLIKAIQEEPAGWGILKQYMQEFGVTKEDEIICIFKKDDKDCPIDNTVEFISAPDYEEKYEQYQKEGYIPSVVRYGGEFTPATGGWVCLPSMEGMAGENNPFEAFLSARYDYNPENTPSYQIRPNTQCQPRRVQEEVTLPILRLMLKYINPEYNRLIEARGGIKACGLQVRSIRGGGRLTLNDDFKVIEY